MKLNQKALAEVEIGIPLIAEGVYHARLDKVELKPNKAGTGQNLVIQIKILDNPISSYKDGSEIQNKGQIVATRYISMTPNLEKDYDPDKSLKELAVAIKHPEDKDLELDDLKGKLCMVKMEHKAESDKEGGGKYPAGNEIKRFTPIPESDNFTAPPF